MSLVDKLTKLYESLERAIEYEDWTVVEDIKDELEMIIQYDDYDDSNFSDDF
jgi:hypothetical protein